MYEAFYGLSSKPFQLNPDPNFYFGSKQHSRAKAYLEYGISRHEGFIVITGEIGAGKTMTLRALIDGLHGSDVVIGNLVTTQLDAEDTLRMVGSAFGFKVKDVPKSELLVTLEAFLLSQTSQGKRCLLIVDEAQNLTMRAVEELRMLSNFQYGNQALLQTFLVGQPEFREILQRPEMEQFRQRVAATCHIGPLDAEETTAYIEHRLKCAGSSGKPGFEPDALQAIHKASHGIPRRINAICDRLLLLGFLCERTDLSVADVDEVVREFANESMVPSKPQAAQVLAVQPDEAGNGHAVLLGDEAAIDLSSVSLDPALATRIGRQLDMLSADQTMDQLQRLERSVLRLERMNVQTLGMLKKLVSAVKKSSSEGAP
ncbi:MAG TPA: XrtA-associated ATPase [Rubrivivax sp.]|nr:XrtA-associated ATPase [Rubrivivax sp.]HPO18333.1 XrtA-associated ATPase [Rubrivivax sp.]